MENVVYQAARSVVSPSSHLQTHTFSVYSCLNLVPLGSGTGTFVPHFTHGVCSLRCWQLKIVCILKFSMIFRQEAVLWLTNACIWSISPAASVTPSHPSLWSPCALGLHFESVFKRWIIPFPTWISQRHSFLTLRLVASDLTVTDVIRQSSFKWSVDVELLTGYRCFLHLFVFCFRFPFLMKWRVKIWGYFEDGWRCLHLLKMWIWL